MKTKFEIGDHVRVKAGCHANKELVVSNIVPSDAHKKRRWRYVVDYDKFTFGSYYAEELELVSKRSQEIH